MPRIRSVHPSLFTDEAWVSCSPLGRLLYIGLWTDADDQGLFEWKPLQIKMRLLAGDVADVPTLLAELTGVDLIASFDASGRKFGAIKNFRAFQRPKKPNAVHPLPPEWRSYVAIDDEPPPPDGNDDASTATSSVPVPHSAGTEPEKPSQMEDGGGVEGSKKDADASSVVSAEPKPTERRLDPEIAGDLRELLAGGVAHLRAKANPDEATRAFEAWNELAKALDLPVARKLDESRKRAIRLRLADGGLDAWTEALAAVERSKHCRGENDRGWKADLDFVCQPKSWRRLLEGFYGTGAAPRPGAPTAAPAFAGPPELRAAVSAAKGDGWCVSYLDRCAWRDIPERALIPPNAFVAKNIRAEIGDLLARAGVTIQEQAA